MSMRREEIPRLDGLRRLWVGVVLVGLTPGVKREESTSFLKKRSKKLLSVWIARNWREESAKQYLMEFTINLVENQ